MSNYRNSNTYYESKPTFNYNNYNRKQNINKNTMFSPSKLVLQQSTNYRSPSSKIA